MKDPAEYNMFVKTQALNKIWFKHHFRQKNEYN